MGPFLPSYRLGLDENGIYYIRPDLSPSGGQDADGDEMRY